MKILLLILIIPLCISFKNCSHNLIKTGIDKIGNERLNSYAENKLFFPKKFVEHFPNKLSANNILFSVNFNVSNIDYRSPQEYSFFVYNKVNDSTEFSPLKNNEFYKKINASDSNQLLIFSYLEDTNKYYDNISISSKTLAESRVLANRNILKTEQLPVPLFPDIFDLTPNTFNGLDSSFTINIINSKPGIFMDITHLKTNKYLPDVWKHGYSRGIAFSENEKIIIYWVVVW